LSEVVSFKVKKDVKRKMEEYADKVSWGEELRKFVEEKVREVEAAENFKRVLDRLSRAKWSVPKGFSALSVREDRDSN